MAISVSSDFVTPELITEEIQIAARNESSFVGSGLVSAGIVSVNSSLPACKPNEINNTFTIPYEGYLGDFEDLATETTEITPKALSAQSEEKGTILHAGLGFSYTVMSDSLPGREAATAKSGARQMMEAVSRHIDKKAIAATFDLTGLAHRTWDARNSQTPQKLDYTTAVDSLTLFGDRQNRAKALLCHSAVKAQLMGAKDSTGRPIFQADIRGPEFDTILGRRIVVADDVPYAVDSMGAVTATGTSPPTMTLSGDPNRKVKFRAECVLAGARGTAKLRISANSRDYITVTTAATIVLHDTQLLAEMGITESTGITINLANTEFSLDNVYTAETVGSYTSAWLCPGSISYWFNAQHLAVQTVKNILSDVHTASMHLYYACHRFKRAPGMNVPGVVLVRTNG